jgi:acyl-coenzyme A thioesterase PaaI-like protein
MPLRRELSIEKLNSRSGDSLPSWFSMKVIDVREGSLTMEYVIRPQYLAPNGFLHAASVIALADTSAGYATIAHLPDGASNFTTIELKSNLSARRPRARCVRWRLPRIRGAPPRCGTPWSRIWKAARRSRSSAAPR